jgi:hypothetical protein
MWLPFVLISLSALHLITVFSVEMIDCSDSTNSSCCKMCVAPKVFCESKTNCSLKVIIHSAYPNQITFSLVANFQKDNVVQQIKNSGPASVDDDPHIQPNGNKSVSNPPSKSDADNSTVLVVEVKKSPEGPEDERIHSNSSVVTKRSNATEADNDDGAGQSDTVFEVSGVYMALTIPLGSDSTASFRLYCKRFKDGGIGATAKFHDDGKEGNNCCWADFTAAKINKKYSDEGQLTCSFTIPLKQTLQVQRTNQTSKSDESINFNLASTKLPKVKLELGNVFLINGRYESHARKGNKFPFKLDLNQLPVNFESDNSYSNRSIELNCKKTSAREAKMSDKKSKMSESHFFNWLHLLLFVIVVTLFILLLLKLNKGPNSRESF